MEFTQHNEDTETENKDDVLLKNQFTPSEETYREYIKALMSRSYKLRYFFLGTLFLLASLFLLSVVIILEDRSASTIAATIVSFYLAILFYFTPKIQGARRLKESLKTARLLSSGNPNGFSDFEASFFNDNFITERFTFQYSQISKVVSSHNYMYLIIEATFGVIIKKDAFTVGDYETFVAFLREKLKDNPKAMKGLK